MKHSFILALFMLFVVNAAYAQTRSFTVKGTVVDAETGEPVPLVYAHLEEISRTTVADADGVFELRNIPSGTYTLSIHRLGYRTHKQKIQFSDSNLNLNIKLESSVYSSDAVEVLGTASDFTGSNLEHASKAIYGADLRRSLGSTLSQTLSSLPGFDQRSNGAAAGRPVIRGLGGNRVSILQDGISSGDVSAQSSDHAVTIDPENSNEIEIARGPAALAFGANAVGGVINVVKNQIPTNSPGSVSGNLSLSGQSVNTGLSGGANILVPAGDFAVQASLSGRLSDNTRTPAGKIDNTAYQTTNNSLGVSYLRPWGYAGASANLYLSSYGIPPDPRGHASGVTIEMKKFQYDAKSEIILNHDFLKLIELSGSFKDYEHKELEGEDAHGHKVTGTQFFLRTTNGSIRIKHNEAGILQHGSIGVTGQFEDYAVLGTGMPPASSFNIGSYLIEDADIGNLHLELGLRYDYVHTTTPSAELFYPAGVITGAVDSTNYKNRNFNALSGSVSAIYSLGKGFSTELSVMRSFRAPSMEELYSEGPHLASYSYDIGNPDLNPERAWAKELSFRYNKRNVRLEITGFHNYFDNYIYAANTGRVNARRADLLDYQTTGTRARLYGIEISGDLKLTRHLYGQFSMSQTTASGRYSAAGGGTQTKPLPFIPPLKATAALRYETGRFEAGAKVIHALKQDRTGEFETPTDGYTNLDIFAQYRIQGKTLLHSFSVSANNLLNTEYYNHLSRIKELSPEPGRNISLLYRVYF